MFILQFKYYVENIYKQFVFMELIYFYSCFFEVLNRELKY